jgi:O-antigen ligase/tetratricopeptide (TPR) repeat protein
MSARKSPRERIAVGPSPLRWITHIAFILAVAVMIGRLMIPDALRDPEQPIPGVISHANPGPATGLVLDLLAIAPALLVLVRRAVDAGFRLAPKWSHLPMFALLCWAMLSTAWASDRFAAAVSSAHFFAAGCLLWAMSQVVRTAAALRLVAAVCFGLLLVVFVQTLLHRWIDVPQTIAYFNQNKETILRQQNDEPGSFAARQFEMKVTSGELQVYFKSSNTVAAVALLLFAACVGIGIQRLADGDGNYFLVLPVIAAGALTYVLIAAKSKTSFFTPFLGVIAVGCFYEFRQQLRRYHRRAFLASVAAVAFAIIALVGHGLYHHGLFPGHLSNSLDFRWNYWIASAGIFRAHPILGVGWDNYAMHYLAYRVPEATEAIRDPHNFLVHFFVELGAIGGLLSIAWVLRLAWEITLPALAPSRPITDDEPFTLKSAAAIVAIGWMLSVLFTLDFSAAFLDMIALLTRPVLLLLVLLFSTLAASMQSSRSWLVDPRPTPWIFWCLVTGLGLFLLHNAIDFSMFEPPALFLFMGLIGAALGVSAGNQNRNQSMPMGGEKQRPLAIAAAVLLTLAWVIAALGFVAPVVIAEQHAVDANDQIQTAPTQNNAQAAAHFQKAIDDLQQSWQTVPYNSDYALRLARLFLTVGQDARAEPLLAQIKLIDPRMIEARLLDAHMRLKSPNPDRAEILRDYQTALDLSPNDEQIRIDFGNTLNRFGEMNQARAQYARALDTDAKLPVGEPNRLSQEQIDKLRAAIKSDPTAGNRP